MTPAISPIATASARRAEGASAVSGVYDDLRARILRLDLPPDATLSRGALTQEYGVSQTPVREALQRLEQDGLVRIFPQSRTVVSRIDLPQLMEAHFLRVAVECETMRRLAIAQPEAALTRAEGLLRMQDALNADLNQVDLFDDLDQRFHRALLDGVGHGGLAALIQARSGHLARARRLDLPREEKMRGIVAAHRAMLAGIRSGDPDRAAQAARDHLSGTVARLGDLRAAHPDFFCD